MRRLSLLLTAAALMGAASAQSAAEPESVGERYNRNNAPKGVQMGPWKVTPTATLRGGYDDNVTTVPDNQTASPLVQLRGRIEVSNGEGADYITVNAEVEQTWYTDADDLDHLNARGAAAFQMAVSDTVSLRGSLGVGSEESADSADEGIIVAGSFDPYVDLAKYLQVPGSFGVNFDGGRYVFGASADLVYTDYDPRVTAGGVTVDQAFRNGTNIDLKARAGYRFTPGTGIFAEGGYNIQSYDDEAANSTGWRAVAGIEFEASRLITGEIFGGYASQSYDLGTEVTGLTYGASVDWFATELMSFSLDAKREFGAEQTEILLGLPVTSAVTRDNVRLGVEYEPLRQVLVRAEGGWRQVDYDGQNRTDQGVFAGLGIDYTISPAFQVKMDYRYDQTTSEVAGETERNVFMLGLTTGY
ncbi:MAG: outer membrane beta-barrel protein [Micropepsaceae bacterium]